MGIQGTGLKDSNVRLRFFSLIFMGIAALSAVIYWRSKTLEQAEYVEIPTHYGVGSSEGEMKSTNFQIDVQDTSPSVK